MVEPLVATWKGKLTSHDLGRLSNKSFLNVLTAGGEKAVFKFRKADDPLKAFVARLKVSHAHELNELCDVLIEECVN